MVILGGSQLATQLDSFQPFISDHFFTPYQILCCNNEDTYSYTTKVRHVAGTTLQKSTDTIQCIKFSDH